MVLKWVIVVCIVVIFVLFISNFYVFKFCLWMLGFFVNNIVSIVMVVCIYSYLCILILLEYCVMFDLVSGI